MLLKAMLSLNRSSQIIICIHFYSARSHKKSDRAAGLIFILYSSVSKNKKRQLQIKQFFSQIRRFFSAIRLFDIPDLMNARNKYFTGQFSAHQLH